MREIFAGPPGPRWQRLATGAGFLDPGPDGLRLVTTDATRRVYSDAQIDDYQGRPRRAFPWRPPLVLTVRGRFSHPAAETAETGRRQEGAARARTPDSSASSIPGTSLLGTAGFGFWNDPFLMTGLRMPALPRALWFFYSSPPSDMKLDLATPGWGWKAAAIDAARWPARVLLPLAPLAVPLMHIRPLYRHAWPLAQRALHICEAPVPSAMTEWHTYAIEWGARSTCFLVDGEPILRCPYAPAGPLGLVLWVDNQYLVATPQGRLRYGLLDVPGQQWLELASVSVEPA